MTPLGPQLPNLSPEGATVNSPPPPMSADSTPSQTQSFLMRRFAEAGIRPHTRFGQNFLIDLNLIDLLVRTADVQPSEVVLEVGTGTGGLTARLAPLAAAVVTVLTDANPGGSLLASGALICAVGGVLLALFLQNHPVRDAA